MIAIVTSSSINVNAGRIAVREFAQPHEKRPPMEPSCAGNDMRNNAAEEIRTLIRPAQAHYVRRQKRERPSARLNAVKSFPHSGYRCKKLVAILYIL